MSDGVSGWNRATSEHSDAIAVYSLLFSAGLVQSAPHPTDSSTAHLMVGETTC